VSNIDRAKRLQMTWKFFNWFFNYDRGLFFLSTPAGNFSTDFNSVAFSNHLFSIFSSLNRRHSRRRT